MIDKYQNHLDLIASKLGCRLDQYNSSTPGMMYVEFGYVEGPTIESNKEGRHKSAQTRYLTNLHELGHFANGHTQGRPIKKYLDKIPKSFDLDTFDKKAWYFDNGVLNSEAEAWEYAINNCIDKILPESKMFMWNNCLGTYYRSAQKYGFTKKGKTFSGRGDRGYIAFSYGEPSEYFYAIKERILK